jgi:hypothetical protein
MLKYVPTGTILEVWLFMLRQSKRTRLNPSPVHGLGLSRRRTQPTDGRGMRQKGCPARSAYTCAPPPALVSRRGTQRQHPRLFGS